MTDTNFPLSSDHEMDDLPRTLRREKEARAREARERASSGLEAAAQGGYASQQDSGYAGADAAATYPATVYGFQVPFFHLVGFFLKAVLAAIPALLLLTLILWGLGQVLKIYFPELLHMQIMITFPKS